MTIKIFRWDAKVRDYELDSQGIVNNANYLNYFEQSRGDYARHMKLDFQAYFEQGYSMVLTATEVKYHRSLRMNDHFYVTAVITSYDAKRIHFSHELRRLDNDKLVAKAMAHVACVDHKTGRSVMPEFLRTALQSMTGSSNS